MKKRRMKKSRKNFWKSLSGCMKAFLVIAAAFLVLGFGTLGSVQSTGGSYELAVKQSSDEKDPCIIYQVSSPEGYSSLTNIRLESVYINVGAIYTDVGSTATLWLYRGSSATSASLYTALTLVNGYEKTETTVTVETENTEETDEMDETEEETQAEETVVVTYTANDNYNWVKFPFTVTYSLSVYKYFKLVSKTCNVLINEIVFVGYDNSLDEEERTPLLIPLSINSNSVVYDYETDTFSNAAALAEAEKTIDSQHIPSLAQSSFFRFGEEEVYSLNSISEMYQGGAYYSGDVYSGDRVYNSLGTIILAFGTLIFGMSPFGLRFFPMLASFGILLIGYFFVKKLFKSEKAGLAFAVLYALCGLSFSLGHLGTPLMIGLFFLFASFVLCFNFFENGMKRAKISGALPLAGSGLLAAAAICVNGAYLVPVLGVVALFIAGVVRQKRKGEAELDAAIAEAEKAEAGAEALAEEPQNEAAASPKQKVADVLNANSYKNKLAIGLFTAFLVFGTALISLLGVLPMYFTYLKLFASPTATVNVLQLIWQAFVGGFTGVNVTSVSQSSYSVWYTLFTGSGETYAVTAAGLLPAVAAVLIGLCGVVLTVIGLVKTAKNQTEGDICAKIVLLAGIALSLIAALFAGGGLAFVFAALTLSFVCAAGVFAPCGDGECKKLKTLSVVCLVALVVCFLLFAAFTFSLPLASNVMTAIFG